MGAMRLRVVGYLVAGASCENEFPAVGKLGMKLALQTEQDMTFCTPMIGKVARAVFHQAHTDIIEMLCTPKRLARLPFVFRRYDLRPIGCAKRNISNFHNSPFHTPNGHTPALAGGARELRLFNRWEAQFVTGGII